MPIERAPGNPSAGSSPRGSPQVLAPSVLAVTSALHYCALWPVCCRWAEYARERFRPCGDWGDRTPDLLLAKQVLYQLS